MTETIGIFGLGLIGKALTKRLLLHDYNVVGFDPDPDCRDALAEMGGVPVSAAEVWQAGTVLAAVFDTDQLASVISAAPEETGSVLIATSTCDPERMTGLGEDAEAKGITLIEAPLSGTSRDLGDGKAVFLVGGDAAVIAEKDKLFKALGRAHYHLGGLGHGNRAKLAVNLVLGLNRAALAEGLVFSEALGLEPEGFLALLQDTAAASVVMPSKGPKMVARDFAPLGKIKQSAKDFDLIQTSAQSAGHHLPFAETYRAMMADCLAHGEGDEDNAAVLLAIERAKA